MNMEDFEARYKSLLDDIFTRFPSVQNAGFRSDSYKPGLDRMRRFAELLGNPQDGMLLVHVAGTNGKGSVSSMMASQLAANGYKTGLFTSPHLFDFRERARMVTDAGCELVSKEFVADFLEKWKDTFTELSLSFFEITTALAFCWFKSRGASAAVIEVGLGGRLDSTNIITPRLSIITSIGLDHCDLLGSTIEKIAGEKAGIIKEGIPVVYGRMEREAEEVILGIAAQRNSRALSFDAVPDPAPMAIRPIGMEGDYQDINSRTVKTACSILGLAFSPQAHLDTQSRTGFFGRWEVMSRNPMIICDIGHNPQALEGNFSQLKRMMRTDGYDALIIVYGVMADKDLGSIVPLMPGEADYIFTAPSTPRAMQADAILARFSALRPGCRAAAATTVEQAVKAAFTKASAHKKPLIYFGGSTFVVAEAVPEIKKIMTL